jgi:hypothetical protein
MWSEFESESVAGRFQLGKLVRSEGRYGWFETGLDGKPAIISVIEALNDEDALLDRLKAAEKVRHPNVVAILETGTATVKGTPLVYAVMESTEENLEDVLRVRALSTEETRQIAEGLVKALKAIHKEKLVCGEIEASSVLAAGDVIKLRSDKLQSAAGPTDTAFASLVSKDVQALGILLYRCLTLKRPQTSDEDPSVELLPQPFSQMVRRALRGQATVEEMESLLRQPVSALKAAESTVVEMPASVVDESTGSSGRTGSMAWMVAGVVLLALVLVFTFRALLRSSKDVSAQPVPPPVSQAKVQTAHMQKPVAATPVRPLPAPVPATATQTPGKNTIWRVVAYTYNHQDQAEHKAQTINSKYPDLKAEVFSPKGNSAPYLVTLGGPMERDAAFQLRNKAVGEGLPRDMYAQNYSH